MERTEYQLTAGRETIGTFLKEECFRELGQRLKSRFLAVALAAILAMVGLIGFSTELGLPSIGVDGAIICYASFLFAYVLSEVLMVVQANIVLKQRGDHYIALVATYLEGEELPVEPFRCSPSTFVDTGQTRADKFEEYMIRILEDDRKQKFFTVETREKLIALISEIRGRSSVSPLSAALYLGALSSILNEMRISANNRFK
jgi:uncharacterized membrane protein (DUF485 family)